MGEEVRKTITIQSERLGCEIVEPNIQVDHVHLLIKIPPKVSISSLMGVMKGNRVFSKFPELKQRPYWGNYFWAEGYCVDTVGLNSEMIRKYVKYQEDKWFFRLTDVLVLNSQACLL